MHEMAIATEIMNIARASVPDDVAGSRIASIYLKIGAFSTVVPDNLRYCFDMATHETDMADTRLEIEEVPLVTRCPKCMTEFRPVEPVFICRQCHLPLDIISGREMEIVSLDIIP